MIAGIKIDSKGALTKEELDSLCADVLKYFNVTVLDENQIETADGYVSSFNSLTYPKEITIAGNKTDTHWLVNSSMCIMSEFDADGYHYKVKEINTATETNFNDAGTDTSTNKRPISGQTAAGHEVNGYTYNEMSTIYGHYYVKFGDDKYVAYEIVLEGAADIPAAQELVSEANAGALHEKFIGFLNDFISSGKETPKTE